jgi:hypothetical protein
MGYIWAAGSAISTAVPFAKVGQVETELSSGESGESGVDLREGAFVCWALRFGLLDFDFGIGRPGAAKPRL